MDMPVKSDAAIKAPRATGDVDDAPDGDGNPETGTSTRITRLLCSRAYFLGVYGSISSLHAICRTAFHARDPGVGYNKLLVAHHCIQSAALSAATLIAVALLLLIAPRHDTPSTDVFQVVAFVLLFAKIAVVNPVLARLCFHGRNGTGDLTIPHVSPVAAAVAARLFPPAGEGMRASYFAGERPFVGYGTEIAAWTLVVNTETPAPSIMNFAKGAATPKPLDAKDLYRAVLRGAGGLRLEGLRIGWNMFIDGRHVDEHKRRSGTRFRRPPDTIPRNEISAMDKEGSKGRRYLTLSMAKPREDLITNQFIRFHQNGKLIFCEFAAYVLAPGSPGLRRLERMFSYGWALYGLVALLSFAGAALLATSALLLLVLLVPPLGFWLTSSAFSTVGGLDAAGLSSTIADIGNIVTAIVFFVSLYLLGYIAWRIGSTIATTLGIVFNVSHQFGVKYSFRETFTDRGQLEYFALQEVARFMKTQEKILIGSICDALKEHDVDASDFRAGLSSYINLGVINAGNIRGNVVTRINSYVGKHPARTVGSQARGVAHAR